MINIELKFSEHSLYLALGLARKEGTELVSYIERLVKEAAKLDEHKGLPVDPAIALTESMALTLHDRAVQQPTDMVKYRMEDLYRGSSLERKYPWDEMTEKDQIRVAEAFGRLVNANKDTTHNLLHAGTVKVLQVTTWRPGTCLYDVAYSTIPA